jgi:tripartite-type tricarboxylate transporter receptor subunit TctC
MEFPRRTFLQLAAGATVLSAASPRALAQAYPTRPVRLIVPSTAGGANDIVARLVCQRLSEQLGQAFVVENRPGAGSNLGTEAVVRASPDGYTLLAVSPPNAVNATLYRSLNFNFIRDIAPVVGTIRAPSVMVVNPSVPAKTIPEFIAYAKSDPGKINMGSAGNGTAGHMSGELFKMMTGIDMVHVPYRGASPALSDLLGGQVQVYFPTVPPVIEFIKEGKLRALAVTSTTRAETLPSIPSVSEFVPGYEASGWSGIGAPRGTPADIVEKLNQEINAALADPKIKSRISDLGAAAIAGSASDFGKLISDETEKWAKVVKFAGIRAD